MLLWKSKTVSGTYIHMLKFNPSQEAVAGSAEPPPSTTSIGSSNGVEMNTQSEAKNTSTRGSTRKYGRHDAGCYDGMSDDATNFSSSAESLASARRSHRMRQVSGWRPTAANDNDGGVSDCSQCRKHRMAKARRNRRRKSRSRSRRRRH
ncbi:PREDICTED: uncharacterized protein LOC108378800 [Rhagoletis zephyria]|uniref:uncharacterized protein LOC108378800 n=1 Tax=Rhagoletis zephyria TaxID=28612 RepID=UPI000811A869|nr:PREDICTED: uncharacterized protein LOC108378800 [Rhagoletis zephyria]